MIKNKGLFVLLACCGFFASTASYAAYDGKYWVVERGDTLYAVARFFHPNNARAQAKLRQQIIALNQNVFAQGAKGLFIGLRLQLPTDISTETAVTPPVANKKVVQPISRQAEITVAQQQWKIRRGDTLYSISRHFFPKSARQQAKLRQQITRLNPAIFSQGANRMAVGMILKLPAAESKAQSKPRLVVQPATKEPIVASKTQLKKPQAAPRQPEPVVSRAPVAKSEPSTASKSQRPRYNDVQYAVSLGYSAGGDLALSASGGHDITFGSGVHLRLSRDSYWQREHGYRLAIAGQFDQVTAGSDSGQMQQVYLQSQYLYRSGKSVLAIGLSYFTAMHYEENINGVVTEANFDDAVSLTMSYEYALSDDSRLGISHTPLESQYENSQLEVDMTRTELYYAWLF